MRLMVPARRATVVEVADEGPPTGQECRNPLAVGRILVAADLEMRRRRALRNPPQALAAMSSTAVGTQ
jgi:hypothetical protein